MREKQNREAVMKMEKLYGVPFEKIFDPDRPTEHWWENYDSEHAAKNYKLAGGGCSTEGCNGKITSSIMRFFNCDIKRVKCWQCQQDNK